MSDSDTSLGNGNNRTQKRNLPSWMTSSEEASKSHGKKRTDSHDGEGNQNADETKQIKGRDEAYPGIRPSRETKYGNKSAASSSIATSFSKLLDGVVFVLSGFVNPERSTLRSQAIEMGADYQADWNSNCTLLVSAFPNTPKFRQVEADCGTIVSKEWILECYNLKKLVDIDSYLMHAGKPWRRRSIYHRNGQEESPPRKSQKIEKQSPSKPTSSTSSKSKAWGLSKEKFSPPELKRWAAADLSKTISWLENQEEKPEQSEIKQIAIEGILTCLQDAIDSLEQKQDIQQISEQWQCVPRVVEELAKLECARNGPASLSKEDLCEQAKACKKTYEEELRGLENETRVSKKNPRTTQSVNNSGKNKATSSDAAGYDSEETIEMTEEEIELAYKSMTS